VSLMTTKQASEANGASREAAQEWARQAGQYLRARQLATQAQLAPLMASARVSAAQRLLGARAWTAPRLDVMSQAVEEQVAPQVAAALTAAARRIEPVPPKPPRRRWPAIAAAVVVIAGGAAAVIILSRRTSSQATEPEEFGETAAGSPEEQREMAPADAVGADVNGQPPAP
jgi:hypothetical protein